MKTDKRLHTELLAVLQWVIVSKRPMTVVEMSIALALRDSPKRSKDIDVRLSIRSFLHENCPHVVKMADSGEIIFVHLSFRDFLLQTRTIDENEVQFANAFHISDPDEVEFRNGLDCLTYLRLDDFTQLEPLYFIKRSSQGHLEANGSFKFWPTTVIKQGKEETVGRFKFLSYAMSSWQHHLQGSDKHPVTIFYFLPTLASPLKLFKWYP